jgi:UDP-N-acetyl-2-amino-2-deoxyglucuronate dehydrogenase
MPSSKKMRVAVIGCGHIGTRHIKALGQSHLFELAAACDIDPGVRASIDNDIPFFTSIEELIASGPAFDVASIATPNGLHESHAIAMIQAGHHVMIEKPIALSKDSCLRIIEAAEKTGREVFCVLQLKYSPVAKWLKQLVAKGVLGKLYLAQVNCFWNRDARYYTKESWHGTKQLDGGVLFTQFSHYIDLLYWLFGDFRNIYASLNVYRNAHLTEFEDTGVVQFEFAGGGTGNLNFTTAARDANVETSLMIIGENGSIKVGGQYLDEIQHCSVKDIDLSGLGAAITSSRSSHELFFEHVAMELAKNTHTLVNANEAMKVVEIIERIYDSAVICGLSSQSLKLSQT